MVIKSAGFLKRLKNFGNKFIQGLDFINDKIVKPVRKITDPLVGATKWGGLINQGLDFASNTVDYLADRSRENTAKNRINTEQRPKTLAESRPNALLPGRSQYDLW